ncbi:beta strand repeat-containing protein [Leptolyngbya sp. NIES-2104]|uniref:beta strand repeat-containing protein n=1 Tax=Leptolyngbya sp. NIES-2104 TaxID=1552121 RepID=UPI0006EC68ED|nr:S-layer family protein [Leptolyngbya sp. NIES-2104]GAP94208.1 putative hemagglutinin-related protein [Leptolyngbya sp. NIES-2104]
MNRIPRSLGRLGGLLFCLIATDAVNAQIVPDSTLPVNSRVEAGCTTCTIEGGTIRDNNLFHSFREFSVPTGGTASFNNAIEVQNIFTRVTGGTISNIDGLIQTNGTANLFLLNPNGMIFGANARLDLGGSFVVSTVDRIVFDNGFAFSATDPQAPPLLTISAPIGLQSGNNPGSILVQGRLEVKPEQTLALVGDGVALERGKLIAEAGHVELGSIASESDVSIDSSLKLNYQAVQQFQDIQLVQAARVDTSGSGGGSIQVQGRRIHLTEGSQMATITEGTQAGKDLIVRASELVEVSGVNPEDMTDSSAIAAEASRGSTGKGGNLTIETETLRVTDGGRVSARTFGAGDGGDLTVRTRSMEVTGFASQTNASSTLAAEARQSSTGNAGNLTIDTQTLRVAENGFVSTRTFGTGNGGNLTIRAQAIDITDFYAPDESPSFISAEARPRSSGNAGNLTIDTKTLRILNGGLLSANTVGAGNGGDLTVRAQAIDIIGFDPISGFSSSFGAQANTNATGNAGNITIETGTLRVLNGGRIATRTFGTGTSGDVTIRARSVEIAGFNSITDLPSFVATEAGSESSGNAGGIVLNVDRLRLADRGLITATSGGTAIGRTASAGNIEIQANSEIHLTDDARIRSNTNAGRGNITLTTPLLVLRRESKITTNASENASGGNITFNGGLIVTVPNENSDITANAIVGSGGRVDITAQGLFGVEFRPRLTALSDITASSDFGIAGNIAIATPDVDLNRGLVELPTDIIDASRFVAIDCSSEGTSQANRSEFYQTGRGGVAPLPTDPNSSNDILEDLQLPRSWLAELNAPIVEAQGWQRNDQGEIVLVAPQVDRWHCGRR